MTPYSPPSSPEAAVLDEPMAPPTPEGAQLPAAKPILVWLAFAAVCLFWGTSGPLLRYTVRQVDPLWLVTVRFYIAGGLIWVVLWLLGRRPALGGLRKLVPSGLALSVTNVLCTMGFQRVEAGTGTLVLSTTAVTFAVADACWPGGKVRPSAIVWLGLLLGLLGVAVLVVSPDSFGRGSWQGYVFLAVSSWTWALSGVGQARHPSGLDPLESTSWQMLIAATATCPVAFLVGGPQFRSITVNGWLGILALVLTASITAYVSFLYVLHRMPAYVLGSYTYVNAIVAAGLGVVWLHEQLSLRFYVAALLVLGGVALIQQQTRGSAAEG